MTDLTPRQILDAIAEGLAESARRFETAEPSPLPKSRTPSAQPRSKKGAPVQRRV